MGFYLEWPTERHLHSAPSHDFADVQWILEPVVHGKRQVAGVGPVQDGISTAFACLDGTTVSLIERRVSEYEYHTCDVDWIAMFAR